MISELFLKYKSLSAAVKCSLWFTIANLIQRGVNVIVTPIYTRLLTTEEFGLYGVFMAWFEILVIFSTLYLYRDVVDKCFLNCQKIESRECVVSTLQGLAFVISGCYFVIALIFNKGIAGIMALSPSLIILMFSCFLFYSPFYLWLVLKRYLYDYKKAVFIIITSNMAIQMLSVAGIVCTRYKAEARIVSFSLITIVVGIMFFFINQRKGKKFFDKEVWKYAFGFNIVLVPHFLSEVILNHSDRIMINTLAGTSETAIYTIAYSIAQLVLLFTQAINMSLVPWQYQKIKSKEYDSLSKVSILVLIVVCGLLFCLVCFAPEAVLIFAGNKYAEAVNMIPILILGIYYSFLYQYFTRIEVYHEKRKGMSMASILAAVLNIVLNYFCIKAFGYVAAAYTTMICYIFLCLLHYLFYKKICNEKNEGKNYYNIKLILAISAGMSIISIVVMFLYHTFIIRYFFVFVLFIVTVVKRKIIYGFLKGLRVK